MAGIALSFVAGGAFVSAGTLFSADDDDYVPSDADPATPFVPVDGDRPSPTAPPFRPVADKGLEGLFSTGCLGLASEGPSNRVPRSIDFEGIPSPIDETGLRIGPVPEQKVEFRDPKDAKFWVSIAVDDAIVGYSYLPLWEIDARPEQQDSNCHPELAIYDEQGNLVGGFVDGEPVLAVGETQ